MPGSEVRHRRPSMSMKAVFGDLLSCVATAVRSYCDGLVEFIENLPGASTSTAEPGLPVAARSHQDPPCYSGETPMAPCERDLKVQREYGVFYLGRPATSVLTLYKVLPAVTYRVRISDPPNALFVM